MKAILAFFLAVALSGCVVYSTPRRHYARVCPPGYHVDPWGYCVRHRW